MSDTTGNIDFQFTGDAKSAVSQLDRLREAIETTLKSADDLNKKLNITFQSGAKTSARSFDKFQNMGVASPSELGTVAIEKYVKDRFRAIDNSFTQAFARITNREFAAKQNVANTTSLQMAIRERVENFRRRMRELNSTEDQLDATMRAAASSVRIRSSRSSDYYRTREILEARRQEEMAKKASMSDTAYSWQRRWDHLASNNGADLFKVQGLVRLNNMFQSTGMQGLNFVADQIVGLDKAFYNLQAVTDTSAQQMGELKNRLIETAQTSKFTALEIADAATTMAQAGLSAKEVGDSIKGVTTLAAASGSTLAQSVDVVTSVLGQFDLRTSETANVANVMTAALNESKLTMEKLALGIQYSGNIAAQAGVSYTELTAVLAGLSNAGIKSGSMLGTGTRQLMIEFLSPSEKLTKRLQDLGINLSDVDMKANGFIGVLKNLAKGGFTTADAMQTFDLRAANAFAGISNNMDTIERAGNSLTLTSAAVKANATQMESFSNIWARLTSNIGAISYKTFEPALDGLKGIAKFAADAVGALTNLGSVLPAVGTLIASAFGGIAAIGAVKMGALTASLTGLSTLGTFLGGLPALATFGAVAAAIAAIAGSLAFVNYAFDNQDKKVEAVRGRLEAYKGAVDSATASLQRIDETTASLANQRQMLDKDDSARKQRMLELEQAFKDLGLTFTDTSVKTEGMIAILEKLKQPFEATLLKDLNGQLMETNRLIEELKKKNMNGDQFDWFSGRSKMQRSIDSAAGFGNYFNWGNSDVESRMSSIFGSKDVFKAYTMASQGTVEGIDKAELSSLITSIQTMALVAQQQGRDNPEAVAKYEALKSVADALVAKADALRELTKLQGDKNAITNSRAFETFKSTDGFKALTGSVLSSLSGFKSRADNLAGDRLLSEEDKQAKLRTLRFDVDAFLNGVLAELDGLLANAKNIDPEVDKEKLREKLRSAVSTLLDVVHSKVVTQLSETDKEVAKLAEADQKKRVKEASKRASKLTESLGSATTVTQLESTIAEADAAFEAKRKAMLDEHETMRKLALSSGRGALSKQEEENFKESQENLGKEIGKAATDAIKHYQELIKKDLDTKIEVIDIQTSLEQTSTTGVLEARQRLIEVTQNAARLQIQMIEKHRAQLEKLWGPEGVNAMIFKVQEEAIQQQREALIKNFQTIVERTKTDLYKANGVERLDARVSLFNSPLHGSDYTDAERAWATRQSQMAKEKADQAYVNDLLSKRAALEVSLANAQKLNNGDEIKLYGAELKIVNDKLKEMPEHLKRAGEAEGEIAKMSTIDRIKMLNNEFIRSLGMKEVDGQWQITAQKFGEYWTQALGGVQSSMKELFTTLFTGTKSAGEAFRQFALSIVNKLLDIATTILTNQILASLFGIQTVGGGKSGGYVATGGGLLGGLFSSAVGKTATAPQTGQTIAQAATASAQTIAVNSKIGNAFAMFGGLNRTQFEAELANPAIKNKLFAMTQAEVGGQGPEAQQAFMESVMNRASARGMTLDQVLSDRAYFPKSTFDNASQYMNGSAAMDAKYADILSQVRNGSNISNYATGNASGTVGFGRLGYQTGTFGGEKYGVEQADIAWAAQQRQLAQAMQPMQQASSAAAQNVQKLAESSNSAATQVADLGKSVIEGGKGGIGSDAVASNVKVDMESQSSGLFSSITGMFSGLMSGLMGMLKGLMSGIGSIFSSIFSGLGFNLGGVVRAANGYSVPTRDSVPVLAQPGEAFLSRSAVSMIGRDGIDYLNAMGNRRNTEAKKAGNDNKQRTTQKVPDTNIWVVSPDQVPPPGPNDFIAAVADNIQRGGTIKTLIRTVSAGRV